MLTLCETIPPVPPATTPLLLCQSDNSCVAAHHSPGPAANAHAHSVRLSVAAPGPLVKLRQAAPGLQCAGCWLLAAAQFCALGRPEVLARPQYLSLFNVRYQASSFISYSLLMKYLNISAGPWCMLERSNSPGSGGGGGGVAAQGFTIRSEAVKLPRKLAAGSNRPGPGRCDLYQDD